MNRYVFHGLRKRFTYWKKQLKLLVPFLQQASMTVTASSTASSASWLCLRRAVKAAVSPFWKTTYQLSTLCGTHSVSYVGWVFLWISPSSLEKELTKVRALCAYAADFVQVGPVGLSERTWGLIPRSFKRRRPFNIAYLLLSFPHHGKTHLLAGLIRIKGILKGIICPLCDHVMQMANLTCTSKQWDHVMTDSF